MRKKKNTIKHPPSVFVILVTILILTALLSYVFKDRLQQLNQPAHIVELELDELTPEVRSLVEISNKNLIKMQSILNKNTLSGELSDSDKNTLITLAQETTVKMNKAVKLDSENANLWFYRCNLYKKLSQVKGAIDIGIESCLRSTELDPEKSEAYLSLGGLYILNKDYNNAIKTFINLTEIDPNDMNAYYNLGHAYLQNGDKEQAKSSFLKALKLVTNQPDKAKLQREIDNLKE